MTHGVDVEWGAPVVPQSLGAPVYPATLFAARTLTVQRLHLLGRILFEGPSDEELIKEGFTPAMMADADTLFGELDTFLMAQIGDEWTSMEPL